MSTTAKLDLFLLRNRVLVAERDVANCKRRVERRSGLCVPALDEAARADLRAAEERLADLRSRLAESVREVL